MSVRLRAALFVVLVSAVVAAVACTGKTPERTLSRAVLEDKVRGGWAGQMIGVAYGGPTEFKSNGKILEGDIEWSPEMIASTIDQDYQVEFYEEKTYTGTRVTFNFQDIPVRSVLQLIADVSDLNIVVADNVGGNLTLRLTNVPWDQALDIVLDARNLDKRTNGNVIWIAPTADIAAREQELLQALQDRKELEPAVQEAVAALWQDINTDTLNELSDFAGYKREFLQLFGFEVDGVDYEADVDPVAPIANLV